MNILIKTLLFLLIRTGVRAISIVFKFVGVVGYVIDCLRKNKHPSHFSYDEAIKLSRELNPKKTILTNLHVDLDYNKLKKKLDKNIVPAYDGLSINF